MTGPLALAARCDTRRYFHAVLALSHRVTHDDRMGARGNRSQRTYETQDRDEEQHPCARGDWCSARTRDEQDVWHPAPTYQAFCHTDTELTTAQAGELASLYQEVSDRSTDPYRSSRGPKRRTPPGSKVLISPAADALLREMAAITAGWAARVRAVPGLQLTPPQHRMGTPGRVAEDCRVLTLHTIPLLALAPGWTKRTYEFPPSGTTATLDRATATCRFCRSAINRAPVSGWWWAIDRHPTAFCDHRPARGTITALPASQPVPDDIEADFADHEIVLIGDDWVTVLRDFDGTDAGLEVLELHWRARRLAGQVPAPAEILDGIPCHDCEEMSALALVEQPPRDPAKPEPPYTRCTACRDEMTRTELTQWAKQYEAWAKGTGVLVCRRCHLGKHKICFWDSCDCAKNGHPGQVT